MFDKFSNLYVMNQVAFAGRIVLVALAVLLAGQPGTSHAQDLGSNFAVDESCDSSGLCAETGGTLNDIDHVDHTITGVHEQEVSGTPLADGDDLFFQTGVIEWSNYINDGGGVIPSTLTSEYGVYAIYEASGVAEANNVGEVELTFDTFILTVFMDGEADSGFTIPSPPGTPTSDSAPDFGPVTVTNDSDDSPIAVASLLFSGEMVLLAGLDDGNYDFLLTDFSLDTLGTDFLIDPEVFYELIRLTGVITSFTFLNSANAEGAFFANLGGAGDLYFEVPEPATFGLFAIGLVGLSLVARRRRAPARALHRRLAGQ